MGIKMINNVIKIIFKLKYSYDNEFQEFKINLRCKYKTLKKIKKIKVFGENRHFLCFITI